MCLAGSAYSVSCKVQRLGLIFETLTLFSSNLCQIGGLFSCTVNAI